MAGTIPKIEFGPAEPTTAAETRRYYQLPSVPYKVIHKDEKILVSYRGDDLPQKPKDLYFVCEVRYNETSSPRFSCSGYHSELDQPPVVEPWGYEPWLIVSQLEKKFEVEVEWAAYAVRAGDIDGDGDTDIAFKALSKGGVGVYVFHNVTPPKTPVR